MNGLSNGSCGGSEYRFLFCLAEKTFELIEQYERVDDNEVRISLLELISIYYSNLFHATDKLDANPEVLYHTEEEAAVSRLVIAWRNSMTVHAVSGEGPAPSGLSSSADCGSPPGDLYDRKRRQPPLHPLHLEALKGSLAKVQRFCRQKIAEGEGGDWGP